MFYFKVLKVLQGICGQCKRKMTHSWGIVGNVAAASQAWVKICNAIRAADRCILVDPAATVDVAASRQVPVRQSQRGPAKRRSNIIQCSSCLAKSVCEPYLCVWKLFSFTRWCTGYWFRRDWCSHSPQWTAWRSKEETHRCKSWQALLLLLHPASTSLWCSHQELYPHLHLAQWSDLHIHTWINKHT